MILILLEDRKMCLSSMHRPLYIYTAFKMSPIGYDKLKKYKYCPRESPWLSVLFKIRRAPLAGVPINSARAKFRNERCNGNLFIDDHLLKKTNVI